MSRLRENTIGESIYNRIKEYDMTSRKEFLKTLSTEHRELYNKYSAVVRKRNSLKKEDNKEKANTAAREGMKTLRATRPKEQQKEQRKPYDAKYEIKRKMTKTEAVTVIQKQYRQKKNKEETIRIAKDILNDIIDSSFNKKVFNGELKAKRGRKIK
jgi:hypothetical protein